MNKIIPGRYLAYALPMVVLLLLTTLGALLAPVNPLRAQTAANEVEVELVEYEIRMPTTLPAGPTTFRVTNNGSVDHNFQIKGQGITNGFANAFPPGQTQILEVDLPVGDYEVYSPISNYADQGMRLMLTVTEDGSASATGAETTASQAVTSTAATTDTMAMTDSMGMTDSMMMTDTMMMTDSMGMTDSMMMTDSMDVVDSMMMTGTDMMPELAIVSDAMLDSGAMTDTGMMTGTGMMLPASSTDLMAEVEAGEPTEEMQAVLDKLAEFEAPPIEDLSAENGRKVPLPGDAVVALLAERGETVAPEAVGSVTHQLIPGPAGNDILLRVITPEGEGPFPIVVYYHGGGWVIASPNAYESSARALANAANSVVVMVAYRQAPESPFPAAVEDSYAGYLWVTENAAEINGDAERIAVAGESAGGNLATVVSLLARENGDPMPLHQVLVYPVTQFVSADTPSALTYADAAPLNRAMLGWFKEKYLANPADAWSPYVSPLLVDDLSGLPSATIIAAQIDPLFSDGEAYAARLEEAGVDVTYQNYEGVAHEFFGMGAVLPEAQDAVALAAEGLNAAFGATAPAGSIDITTTTGMTDTEMMTGTEMMTDTEAMTDTEMMTGTETITGTGMSGEGEVVQVSLVEWAIEMPESLTAGTITFAVSNDGQRRHNLEIEGQGVEESLPNDLESGQRGILTVDLPAGEYTVYCPVGNHAGQGMELTLTVTE